MTAADKNKTLCDVEECRIEAALKRCSEIRNEREIPQLEIRVTNPKTGTVTEFLAVFDSRSKSCRFSVYECGRLRSGNWSKSRFCKWLVGQFGAYVNRAQMED